MKPLVACFALMGGVLVASAAEPAGKASAAGEEETTIEFSVTPADAKGFPQVVNPAALKGADFDDSVSRAILAYTERLRVATAELAATRARILREKEPWLKTQRAAEDKLLGAETSLARLESQIRGTTEERNRLAKDATNLYRNASYVNSLAQDSLKAFTDGLLPGEDRLLGDRLAAVQQGLTGTAGTAAAMDAADFMLEQVRLSLGGYAARGATTVGEGNVVQEGTLAFVGPQAFFRSDAGVAGVVVRLREGSTYPVTFVVPEWPADQARLFFEGGAGRIAADATGNKALRLKQTSGTVWEHIRKGGYVAFAIIGVGVLALALIILKLVDVARLTVDEPPAVRAFLARFASGGRDGAAATLGSLKATTRELFATGLAHLDEPKVALEERLQAFLLRQRLHFERRLPLLAVIATAAPLMGLLGTVVGMVKTFALITVFGTGNAGKLASGISEVLVATELGLAVAIPTLVIHGFLSQRISRQLATLERYALEFVTTTKSSREEVALP